MKARDKSDKKDQARGTVRKRRIDTERVTNLGPFWDNVEEDDRQSRGEAAESSSAGVGRSRSRRSSRGSRRDGDEPEENAVNAGIDDTFMVTNGPESIDAALRGGYREEWVKAINSVLDSLEIHDTWTVVPTTDETRDLRTISSRMVLQRSGGKTDALHDSKHTWLRTVFGNVPVLTSSKPRVRRSRSLRFGLFYRRLLQRTMKSSSWTSLPLVSKGKYRRRYTSSYQKSLVYHPEERWSFRMEIMMTRVGHEQPMSWFS